MKIFWALPVPANWPPKSAPAGLILSGVLRISNGSIVALARSDGHPSLLVNPNAAGPGRIIPLALTGRQLTLAEGADGFIWIGGFRNDRYEGAGSAHLSEAYLAKIDNNGRVIWERAYGEKSDRIVQSVAPLPSGDVVLAGTDSKRTWLAKVSADGRLVWERTFGRGAAAITSYGTEIAVVAFDTQGGNANEIYREDVALWRFTGAGELIGHRIIREGVNRLPGAYRGKLLIKPFKDSIYVFSEGSDLSAAKPLEVIKYDSQWRLVWRKALPETIIVSRGKSLSCVGGITVLANGDPVVSCSTKGALTLFVLNSNTGEATAKTATISMPPSCDEIWSPALFLTQIANDTVWVFGSPPTESGGASCTWLGEVSLEVRSP